MSSKLFLDTFQNRIRYCYDTNKPDLPFNKCAPAVSPNHTVAQIEEHVSICLIAWRKWALIEE